MENKIAMTISEIHAGYKAGSFSVSEIVERSLHSFSEHAHLNTAITLCEEKARLRAATLDVQLQNSSIRENLPPLFGIPLGVKDVLQLQDERMTCASKILDDYISPFTATAVQRAIDNGAIPIAKLNCDEFAMGSSNESSAYGPVRNPVHAEYIPGGSSGGSASAVGAGIVPIALGTDTGGSIRQPAALCGVYGLKPTYGRVSRYGLAALASSLDQIGPFATCVRDIAVVMEVISGPDARDATTSHTPLPSLQEHVESPSAQLRIGVPKEYFSDVIDASISSRIRRIIEMLSNDGAEIREVSLPRSSYALATYYLIQPAEASSNLARYDGIRFGHRVPYTDAKEGVSAYERSLRMTRAEFGPEVRRRIMLGTYVLSAGYAEAYYRRALKVRRLITQDFLNAFEKCDIILGPTSPCLAWKLGEKADPLTMYMADIYTVAINLAGLPAMSVPVGKGVNAHGDSLPIGVQLIAPHWREDVLIKVSAQIEKYSWEKTS